MRDRTREANPDAFRALQDAGSAIYSIEGKRDKAIEQRIAREVKPLRAQADKLAEKIFAEITKEYEERVNAAHHAKFVAEMELAKASAKNTGWLPEGTVVVRWTSSGYWGSRRPKSKAGERGIVRICDHDTRFAENIRYGRPSIGETFVRILKKDGSESLKIGARWLEDEWFPEGVDPNTLPKEAE